MEWQLSCHVFITVQIMSELKSIQQSRPAPLTFFAAFEEFVLCHTQKHINNNNVGSLMCVSLAITAR